MSRKIFTLFISLLVAAALAVLAQSPTTSAPPGSTATQDPYGATLDHPNPVGNTAPVGTTTSTTVPITTNSAAPATDTSTATSSTTSTDSMNNNTTPTTSATTPTTTTDTSTPAGTSTDASTPQTLPRTGSELPLLAALGLLALGGAVTARTFAKRST